MKTTSLALSAALLLGVAGSASLLGPVPAHAAGKLEIKDKALFEAYTGAQAADKAGNFKDALCNGKFMHSGSLW